MASLLPGCDAPANVDNGAACPALAALTQHKPASGALTDGSGNDIHITAYNSAANAAALAPSIYRDTTVAYR